MKKVIFKIRILVMTLGVLFLISCDGEDGMDGAVGPQGPAGAAGADGVDGEDGNANVQTFVFDLSDSGGGATISAGISSLTQDVLDNDLLIAYLRNSQGSTYFAIPASVWPNGTGGFYDVVVDYTVGNVFVSFYEVGSQNLNPISEGELGELKIILVESTSTVSGRSSRDNLLNKLKADGIDLNDYEAVMDYFGLDY